MASVHVNGDVGMGELPVKIKRTACDTEASGQQREGENQVAEIPKGLRRDGCAGFELHTGALEPTICRVAYGRALPRSPKAKKLDLASGARTKGGTGSQDGRIYSANLSSIGIHSLFYNSLHI